MSSNLMILTATKPENVRLIRIPEGLEEREAYRYVTGLIAKVEEGTEYNWDDILDSLEERGFEAVDFVQGPSLD